MLWSVVKFPREETVEVVPTSWYINQSEECFWPPPDTKKAKVAAFIKNCDDPKEDWKVYSAVLLGQYDELTVAQKKAKKAEITSDLSSNSECLTGRGFRQKKTNTKYTMHSDSSSREESSDDDNIYPKMQKNSFGPVSRPNLKIPSHKLSSQKNEEKNKSYSESFAAFSTPSFKMQRSQSSHSEKREVRENYESFLTPSTEPSRSRSTPPYQEGKRVISHTDYIAGGNKSTVQINNSYKRHEWQIGTEERDAVHDNDKELQIVHTSKQNETEEGFRKMVLEELSLLNLKLDAVMDKMTSITKVLALLGTPSYSSSTDENLERFYEKIPIKNDEGISDLENWLNDKKNYKIMLMELNRIGGSGLPQSVRKILYRILTNEVTQKYSWDGAKQKRSFKNLRVSSAILDAVKIQFKEVTETEIINIIKTWLVKAKERIKMKTVRTNLVENENKDEGDQEIE